MAPHDMTIDTGIATLALPGEIESGDLSLVKHVGPGVLVAVVDGLGHGEEAAAAAHAATGAIGKYAKESLPDILRRCQTAVNGTRGVVLSLAYFDPVGKAVTWLGVGNVCGVLLRGDRAARPAHVWLLPVAGFVGSRAGEPEHLHIDARMESLARGDTVIFATDGIATRFADAAMPKLAPQALADHILARHATGKDDALVLVTRFVG
ncbi:MAG: SpoIIE family protein phosphatase [Gemmatimonadales bacterium]